MCFAEEHNTMIKPELEIELLNREIKELTICPSLIIVHEEANRLIDWLIDWLIVD